MFQTIQTLWKVFKDILICNYYRLIRKRTYPRYILPKINYQPLIDIDALLNKQDLILLRRSDLPTKDVFNELGYLRDAIISIKDIPDLSMNLMGAFFKITNIRYIPISAKATTIWPGGIRVFLSDFLEDYKIIETCSPIFINAKDLHNIEIPFIKPFNKDSENLFKSLNYKHEIVGSEIRSKGKSIIKHSPTYLNYWHVEIGLWDPNDSSINRGKSKKISEALSKFIIEHILSVKATPVINISLQKIPKSYYSN